MKARFAFLFILLSFFPLTACWDMIEPNQRALWIGSAVDKGKNGRIELSEQIVIPAAMGQTEGGAKKKK